MKSSSTAYILWLLGLLGFCGIHRFYADKPISGIVWLLTGGLCFVGQFIDLVLVPTMIDEVNIKRHLLSK